MSGRACVLIGGTVLFLMAGSAYAQLGASELAELRSRAAVEGWTFTVGENSATSRSLEELCGLKEPPDWREKETFDPCLGRSTPPSSFDWRAQGGVTPIKDQRSCGSCWAFGTVAPLECAIKIKDGTTVDLSEQWLVSCNQEGYGCGGGWWVHEYHQWKTDACGGTGAVLESSFPYAAADLPCNCPYQHEYQIDSWAFIGGSRDVIPSDLAMKQAILEHGPISVAVCVNSAFHGYTGGVFNACSAGSVNHAIALVGWDDTQGCWFLRNSWGPGWGESGYMRIAYGCSSVGYAACYIDYPGRDALRVSPSSGLVSRGESGGPFTPSATTYDLTNASSTSLDWATTWTQSWLTVTPSAGTLAAAETTSVQVQVNSQAESLPDGRYTDQLTFANLDTGFTLERDMVLRVGQIESFVEMFTEQDNDLAYQTLTFTPSGTSNFYTLCHEAVDSLPTDPTSGTVLTLNDDTSVLLAMTGGAQVPLYGNSYGSFHVGSNGYVTFITGDSSSVPSFETHFNRPRISMLFDDLDPSASGATVSYRQLADRMALTFENVPLFGQSDPNTFQLEMFYSGVIRITYLQLGDHGGLVGLSRGDGLPDEFSEIDFSGYGHCGGPGPLRVEPATGASFKGPKGGPFEPTEESYLLSNDTSSSLTWSATGSAGWFTATPSGGTLAPGESSTVIVTPAPPALALPPTTYYGTVTFATDPPAGIQVRPVRLQVTGDVWSPPAFLNSAAPLDSRNDELISCASDGNGHWVAVWQAYDPYHPFYGWDYDLFVANSSDGVNWSDQTPLQANARTDNGHEITPHIATDGNGVWVAIWMTTEDPSGNYTGVWRILYSRSLNNGATWSPPSYVSPGASSETGHSSWPRVAFAGDGKWVAVWKSDDKAGGTVGPGQHLFASRSDDDGLHWTNAAVVDTQALTLGQFGVISDVACDRQGNCIAVCGSDNSAGGSLGSDYDILCWRSSDYGATWSAAAPVCAFAATDSTQDCYPRVATDCFGNWMTVWQTFNPLSWTGAGPSHMVCATSTDNGVTWSAPAIVSQPITGLDQQNCTVACDKCGNFVVGWSGMYFANASKKIQYDWVSHSSDFGATWGEPLALDADGPKAETPIARQRPCICTDGGGNWLMAWNSDSRFNGSGGPDSDERFAVLQTGECFMADMSISQEASPDPAFVGDPVTFVLTAFNDGPGTASDVLVVNGMTPGTGVISATPSQGSCDITSAGLTWIVGAMAAGSTASLGIVATASLPGEITNVATVSSTAMDPVGGNNTATAHVTILPRGLLVMDDETFSVDCTNPTPGGTTGWTPLQAGDGGCGVDYDAANGAVRTTVSSGTGQWRINGWISANTEWLPYNQVGPSCYVRAKFYVYRSGQVDMDNLNQIPNMRMRVAARFAVTAQLEAFSHLSGDPAGTNAGRDLRPSNDPINPSVYRVDFDPQDVPAMRAEGEGILRGFEAYSQEPQENGSINLTESVVAIYPASLLADSAALELKAFQTGAGDAGDLRVFNSTTDGPFYRKYILISPGQVGQEVGLDGATDPLCWESASGVTFDSIDVAAQRVGIVSREFTAVGAYTDRIRVKSNTQYKVRYHVISDTPANRNPQMRMRARALKFAWSNKLEVGGALAAGNSSNAIAQQALPGTGTMNPDKLASDDNGGWYTMLMNTPMCGDIQPTQPFIEAQPGPGVNVPSMRDIMFGFDLIDTISGSPSSSEEKGRFTLNRIEIRSFDQVVD